MLARRIERTLREQPPLAAPRTLETRVMAELSRRSAAPWWRRSFAHWPAAARAGFLVLAAAVAGATFPLAAAVPGWREITNGLSAYVPRSEELATTLSLLRSLGASAGTVAGSLPLPWLYGGLALLGGLYALLFGLAATAYRTLWVIR